MKDDMITPLGALSSTLDHDMREVNALIVNHMQSSVPMIPQLAGYLIAAGGKRIRPLLTLASTALFDGDMIRAHRLAAAVEFIHTATLLHDDVVDDSDERRGKPSAKAVFGNEASVLVGDFLFSRAFQLMVADGNLDVLRILSDASATISEGEVLQLSTQNNLETSMDEYLKVIEGKTAALFAAACEVGPVIADQKESSIKNMRDYGMALGMAFQIVDDVLDYAADQEALGKTVGDDFREGKMSAPVILALQSADTTEKEFWNRTIGDKNQKDDDLKQAQELIDKHDVINKGLDIARNYANDAKTKIESSSDLALSLRGLCDYVVDRSY
ncbi:MAG: polyprenyl synthetase family protein [Pseudomonadota bacterium]